MKRFPLLVLAAFLPGCGITLPSEESVVLTISPTAVAAGRDVDAVLVNGSSEELTIGILPCDSRVIDELSGEYVGPVQECDAVGILFRAGTRHRFAFPAPGTPGVYRLEVLVGVSNPHSDIRSVRVRSQVFSVTASAAAE